MTVIETARETAKRLHEGKAYGKDSNMFEQLEGTVQALEEFSGLTGVERDNVIAAAYLSKCQEQSKLGDGQAALTDEELLTMFGPDVAQIVKEVNAEPKEDKTQSADKIWLDKIHNWAEKCTPATREILMAEKRANFVTSFTAPSDKKEPAWHAEYYLTRMLMVDVLRSTNEALYQHLREWAVKGIALQVQKMAKESGKSVEETFEKFHEEYTTNKNNAFVEARDIALLSQRSSLIMDASYPENYHPELTAPAPQKIETVEPATTIESKTLSLEEVAALGTQKPIKPVSKKTVQKPLDMTNKSVFTYVYGKGVVR